MDALDVDRRLWAHSPAAHRLFGFCSSCTGRTLTEELTCWRDWAHEHLPNRPSPRHAAP